jgi:hypothetical protein
VEAVRSSARACLPEPPWRVRFEAFTSLFLHTPRLDRSRPRVSRDSRRVLPCRPPPQGPPRSLGGLNLRHQRPPRPPKRKRRANVGAWWRPLRALRGAPAQLQEPAEGAANRPPTGARTVHRPSSGTTPARATAPPWTWIRQFGCTRCVSAPGADNDRIHPGCGQLLKPAQPSADKPPPDRSSR